MLAVALPRWDLPRLTSGTNVYFEGWEAPDSLLFVREDVHGGVTTVTKGKDGVLTLLTNGKFQGNTGWEMNAQRFFAHYPSLFVKPHDDALVIGLGTGPRSVPWPRTPGSTSTWSRSRPRSSRPRAHTSARATSVPSTIRA